MLILLTVIIPVLLDPSNVLNYYWQIESSGISGFDANVLLQYLPGDVWQ